MPPGGSHNSACAAQVVRAERGQRPRAPRASPAPRSAGDAGTRARPAPERPAKRGGVMSDDPIGRELVLGQEQMPDAAEKRAVGAERRPRRVSLAHHGRLAGPQQIALGLPSERRLADEGHEVAPEGAAPLIHGDLRYRTRVIRYP